MSSVEKGKRFERQVVRDLRACGWKAERTAPMQAGDGVARPDVTAGTLPFAPIRLAAECKVGLQVPKFFVDAMQQAQACAGDGMTPVLFAKRDRCRALVVMYFDDFARLF